MSATNPTDDNDLRRYLLGRLPEEAERALEARLLADPRLSELAEAVEAEILDEHFRGELAAADCQGLLDRLGASPAGRRRIALAQGLAAITTGLTTRVTRPESAPVLPFRPRVLARPAVRAALAAALVGAAVVVWHVHAGSTIRPEATPNQQVAVHRQPLLPRPATPAPATSAEVPPLPFSLSLMTLRGGGESLPELPIPVETTVVALRLHLPTGETSSAYDVSLKREGEVVLERQRLRAPRPPGTPEAVLEMRLPASALAAGIYELEVRGVAPDGSTELVGAQNFRVVH